MAGVFRAVGRALEKFGTSLQGEYAVLEQLSRHREVMAIGSKKPAIAQVSFIAPSANVVGDVQIDKNVGVWYGAVLNGDVAKIRIGENSMIKDRAVLSSLSSGSTVNIGKNVLIGQGAVVGAATIEDGATIGMGATVSDGAVVQKGAFVAPGSIVDSQTTVPAGQIFAGAPAKFLRNLSASEAQSLARALHNYAELSWKHSQENNKSFLEVEQDKSDVKWRHERSEDYDSSLGTLEKNPRAQVW